MTTDTQKHLVILAIDDAWRDLRRSVNAIRAEDASKPGICGEWSVNQVVFHIGSWEELLIERLHANGGTGSAQHIDADDFNDAAMNEMESMDSRAILERFESVHRRLRDALEWAPAKQFETGHEMRKLIDEWAYLHYEEHAAQISAWASDVESQ